MHPVIYLAIFALISIAIGTVVWMCKWGGIKKGMPDQRR